MKNIPTQNEWTLGGAINLLMGRTYQTHVQGLPPCTKRKRAHPIASVYGNSEQEVEANASLICDAGNTYNQTQLTPSEILAQRNEAVKVLKYSLSIFSSIADTEELTEDDLVNVAIKKIQSLISKIEQ